MEQYDQIGARLDRLPLARFHYRIFGIISFSLLLTGFFELFRQCCFSKAGKQWMVK
ncbi:metabolite transport protein [Escherichia coli]|uniref:Metabolite transport protein n=1 Tax=Escherichia coli TaxID=562 RepID=A0A376VGW9_ECOLX|nr:metabolite transport protein [Escherichia coli]